MKTLFHILLAGLVGGSAAQAAQPAKTAAVVPPGGEKTHTLFMGADVSVEIGEAFHRVRDVSRSSWVVNVGGRPEIIPTRQKGLNLRVERSLKLTERSATITDFKGERAYSPGNHPRMQALVSQIQLSAFTTEQAMAAEKEFLEANQAASWGSTLSPQVERLTPAPSIEGALNKMTAASDLALGQLTGTQFHQNIADEQLKAESYDAIEVAFELSSEKPLQNPYVIIVAQFREPKAEAKMARHWIYAESIDPIDETPRKFHLLRAGFPHGYTLDGVEVHLYNQGKEVATNVSSKRVPLTAEEAFQYLVIEHIGQNKGKTVAASPIMVGVSPELKTRLAAGDGQQVYYVSVSKDGMVTQAFEDAARTKAISDPVFAEAVKRIFFKPALESGKPVDSQLKIDVTKLPL